MIGKDALIKAIRIASGGGGVEPPDPLDLRLHWDIDDSDVPNTVPNQEPQMLMTGRLSITQSLGMVMQTTGALSTHQSLSSVLQAQGSLSAHQSLGSIMQMTGGIDSVSMS